MRTVLWYVEYVVSKGFRQKKLVVHIMGTKWVYIVPVTRCHFQSPFVAGESNGVFPNVAKDVIGLPVVASVVQVLY